MSRRKKTKATTSPHNCKVVVGAEAVLMAIRSGRIQQIRNAALIPGSIAVARAAPELIDGKFTVIIYYVRADRWEARQSDNPDALVSEIDSLLPGITPAKYRIPEGMGV